MNLTNPNQQLKSHALRKNVSPAKRLSIVSQKHGFQDTVSRRYKSVALAILGAAAVFLSGCQSTAVAEKTSAPVIPRESGVFDTYGMGKSKTDAIGDAMNNAEITCRKYQQNDGQRTRVIVTKDEVKYNGIVNEKTGAMIDKASKVIGILSGQKLPDAASDDDYEAHITFKCL